MSVDSYLVEDADHLDPSLVPSRLDALASRQEPRHPSPSSRTVLHRLRGSSGHVTVSESMDGVEENPTVFPASMPACPGCRVVAAFA